MTAGRAALAFAGLAAAACTTLDDVERDRCGNGVVEPGRGEDCDRADPACGAPGSSAECRLMCGSAIAGDPGCPDGGACGVDGVCYAPSGQLDLTMSGQWTARHLLVGDTNDDRYPELIGIGDHQLELRLGGPDGAFVQSVTLPNLPLFDVPRAGDVNGDGLADVLVPVGIGLYSLVGDPLTTLQPILQDSFAMPTDGPMIMTSVRYTTGAGSNIVPATQMLAALRVGPGPDCPVPGGCDIFLLGDGGVGLPPGRRAEHVLRDEIPWAPVLGGTASDIVAALAFGDDPSTVVVDESGVFAYQGDPATDTLSLIGEITGLPGKVSRGAWLADLDRDARADLLISVTTPAFGEAVLIAWGRVGGFETPVYLIGGPVPSVVPSQPLAWADLDRDAQADLITDSGVYFSSCIVRTCTFILGSSQAHAWRGAVVADVNGDGDVDVAAFTRGAVIVDVLLGTGARGFWNDAPLAAPGDVVLLRTGDFDGNGVADLALVTAPFDVSGADEIHVSFGRRDQPPAPAAYMGFAGSVVAMDAAQAPLPGRLDTIDDLLVASERATGRGIAILLGSTSQRMVAPLIPLAAGNSFNLIESILTVSLDGDPYDDVICFTTTIDNDGAAGASSVRVYTSDAAGTLAERTPGAGVPIATGNFVLRGALWVAIPGQGGGPATVVGIDGLGRALISSVSCAGATCSMSPPMPLLTGAEVGEPTSLHAADLDGDGDQDLVATFRPADGERGAALVWHAASGGFGAAQIIAPPTGLVFTDVTAVDLDLDGRRALLFLVRGETGGDAGVLIAERGSDGVYPTPVPATGFDAERAGQGVTIHGGDLTGDGLADIAIVSGSDRNAPRAIAVFTQRAAPGALADD